MKRFYVESTMTLLATSFAVAVLLWLATACSPANTEPSDSGLPVCSDVWVVGQTLPSDYEGCMDGDALVLSISNSAGAVVYDDRLVALPGTPIREVGGQQ
jgi:hypothetical protein